MTWIDAICAVIWVSSRGSSSGNSCKIQLSSRSLQTSVANISPPLSLLHPHHLADVEPARRVCHAAGLASKKATTIATATSSSFAAFRQCYKFLHLRPRICRICQQVYGQHTHTRILIYVCFTYVCIRDNYAYIYHIYSISPRNREIQHVFWLIERQVWPQWPWQICQLKNKRNYWFDNSNPIGSDVCLCKKFRSLQYNKKMEKS